MKIYLAAAAPGTEITYKGVPLPLPRRLLSYLLIKRNKFECGDVFNYLIKTKNEH